MPRHQFIKRLALPRSAADVFAWHEQPGALIKLIPPGDPVQLVEHTPGKQGPIGDGARVVLALGAAPFQLRWVAVHEGYIPQRQFIDVQVKGPFAFWRHTHRFSETGEQSCILEDHVEYQLPFGALGDMAAHRGVRARVERMFAWRHRATFDALVRPEQGLFRD